MDEVNLRQLYSQGKSIAEIASTLSCSIHKVVYWMDKYSIKRRSHSEAAYCKANPFGDPFSIKENRSSKEHILYGLGVGIYWGEGNKVTPQTIRVSNTDVALLKTFISFLNTICGVPYHKMHYSIVTFNDTDPIVVRQYWAKHLEISAEKFGTIVTIPPQGKGTYKRKSQYGVCSVTVGNVKLKTWLMNQIDKMKMPR